MPIKIINVTRDLNVGITTVVEFLHAKGYPVESNPNTKITDEQYILLVKELGKSLTENERKQLIAKLTAEPPPVKVEVKVEAPKPPEEIKTQIPEAFMPKIVSKGKIDLSSFEPKQESKPVREEKKEGFDVKEIKKEMPPIPAKEEKTPKPEIHATEVVEEKKESRPAEIQVALSEAPKPKIEEPVVKEAVQKEVEKPQEVVVKQEVVAKTDEAPKSNVFRLKQPKLETGLKVTGKIDLSTINQSTRPKKKSKEEKKKEREEKQRKPVVDKKPHTDVKPPVKPQTTTDVAKRKRKRIKKDRVDISSTQGTNFRPVRTDDRKPTRLKKPIKAEVNEEDVQKQIKETLARLTNKGLKSSKGAKYRRDKRDAAERREMELLRQEERESRVLKLTEFVTANDIANMMNISVSEVISTCMSIGIFVSINQRLDAETINIVAEEFGFKTE
jgi:translation initiation factor IF-2